MKKEIIDKLGKPDIACSGLSIWILGREFPDAQDEWDGNWLRVVILCRMADSQTSVLGSIIDLPELCSWNSELKKLQKNISGEAELYCMEPEFSARICLDKLGAGSLYVQITPDHLKERHEFTFEVDQSYLPQLIHGIDAVLEKFPVR